ncbi:hypothetical protein BDAP_001942 [Binucleata daphniae]
MYAYIPSSEYLDIINHKIDCSKNKALLYLQRKTISNINDKRKTNTEMKDNINQHFTTNTSKIKPKYIYNNMTTNLYTKQNKIDNRTSKHNYVTKAYQTFVNKYCNIKQYFHKKYIKLEAKIRTGRKNSTN